MTKPHHHYIGQDDGSGCEVLPGVPAAGATCTDDNVHCENALRVGLVIECPSCGTA